MSISMVSRLTSLFRETSAPTAPAQPPGCAADTPTDSPGEVGSVGRLAAPSTPGPGAASHQPDEVHAALEAAYDGDLQHLTTLIAGITAAAVEALGLVSLIATADQLVAAPTDLDSYRRT